MTRPRATLTQYGVLPALLCALLLTACAGSERVRLALPPADRAEQVTEPRMPVGEALCDGQPCLSDRETAGLIAGAFKALREANGRLAWLHDWILGAGKPRRIK